VQSDAAHGAVRVGWLSAWQERNYRLYAGGVLLAGFGLQMLNTAVLWDVWERSQSAMSLGYVGLARALPVVLLAIPAGQLVDRVRRHRLLSITQVGFALVALMLAVATLSDAPLWFTYVALTVSGCVRAFNMPTRQSLLPSLVPAERFQNAITWNSAIFQVCAIGGPILAGAVLAFAGHAWVVFAAAAVGCLVFATTAWQLQPRQMESPPVGVTAGGAFAGISHIVQERTILGAISLDLLAVLFGGATALLPIYATTILGTDAFGLGVLKSAPYAGALLMAGVMAVRPEFRRAGAALLCSVALFGASMIVFGLSTSLWVSVIALAVGGAVDNISVVIRHVLVQTRTPDHMRGRVTAVNSVFIECSNELGGFESGAVAAWLGPVTSVVSGGIGTLVITGLIAWWLPDLRRLGRLVERPSDVMYSEAEEKSDE
jgi:MFS family permease